MTLDVLSVDAGDAVVDVDAIDGADDADDLDPNDDIHSLTHTYITQWSKPS